MLFLGSLMAVFSCKSSGDNGKEGVVTEDIDQEEPSQEPELDPEQDSAVEPTDSGTASDTGQDTGESGEDTGTLPAGPPLQAVGGHFVDAQGGVVILRGINVSGNSKVPPFVPFDDVTELDPLPGWGFNNIRLVFNWEAYEVEEGVYDEDYLDAMAELADAAWDRGMYVLMDIHQDGYSRHLAWGCGDGFPQWSIPPGLTLDTPDNGMLCAGWGVLVATDPDVHASFSAFYADTHGVRTRYLAMLGQLAERFADHPGVIGYDLLNEPWGWEDSELSPLYEDATETIRAIDPDAMTFIEGHADTNGGIIQTTLSEPGFGNFAYAPHFYETTALASHIWTGLTTATDIGFGTMTSKAQEWNAPLYVGEFGMHADTVLGGEYVALQYTRLDDHLASGAQWNYTPGWTEEHKDGWNHEDLSIVDDQGQLREIFQVRPQPWRFSGIPLAFSATEQAVTFSWEQDPAFGDTTVFLPGVEWWGSDDLNIESEATECAWDMGTSLLTCTGTETATAHVSVTPR
jgi:endoglycosylceramidase